MELKQLMMDVMSSRDIQTGEDYVRKVNKVEFIALMTEHGFELEAVNRMLGILCDEGRFAVDEQNVYEYEI